MRLPYRSVLDAPVIRRVRVTPDTPDGLPEREPRSRRPHGDMKVAAVRRLIEETTLTYSEIAKRTGVGRASICRWTRDQNWQRPLFAPRATDTVPRARASAKLKRRTLAARLDALAQRYVRELEETPGVDLDRLAAALELAKMAKLAAMPRKRRRTLAREQREAANAALSALVPAQQRELPPPVVPAKAGTHWQTQESVADTLARLRAAGVRLDRAPDEAEKDFIDAHAPPREEPALRQRGR